MPHKPGHNKDRLKPPSLPTPFDRDRVGITDAEETLRRRESRKAGGSPEEQQLAIAEAERKARETPAFRKLKAGDPIPGGGVDPGTAQQGTFKGSAKELVGQRRPDLVEGIQSTGLQAQFDIANRQREQQTQILTVSDQTIQELQNVQDPEEQSLLMRILFGDPAQTAEERGSESGIPTQGTVPLGLGALTPAVGTGGQAIQAGRVGQTVTKQTQTLVRAKEVDSAIKAGTKFPTTGKEAIDFVKNNKLKTLIGLAGSYFLIDSAVLGPSELATWVSADNIGSGVAIQIRDIEFGFNQGTVSGEEMTAFYNQADLHLKNARTAIDEATSKNPQLWPHRERYMESNDINREALELSRARTGL